MKTIRDKMKECLKQSVNLRGASFDIKTIEHTEKIREKQQDAYNKYIFFKKLNSAMDKLKKEEDNNEI